MAYLVGVDYGPYDGGFRLRFMSLDKAKAAIWLAEHNEWNLCLKEVPLDQAVDGWSTAH